MGAQIWPRLPVDLVLAAISSLDDGTPQGHRALLACARVSEACRATAEAVLYRHVVFRHPSQLAAFLTAFLGRGTDSKAQERAKQRILVIEQLELCDPYAEPGTPVPLIWEAAMMTPGVHLFPRVQHLVVFTPSWTRYVENTPNALWPRADAPSRFRADLYPVPPNILVFDTIDICAQFFPACALPALLPARRLISLTVHGIDWGVSLYIGSYPPAWGQWETCALYDWNGTTNTQLLSAFQNSAGRDGGTIHALVHGSCLLLERGESGSLIEETKIHRLPAGPLPVCTRCDSRLCRERYSIHRPLSPSPSEEPAPKRSITARYILDRVGFYVCGIILAPVANGVWDAILAARRSWRNANRRESEIPPYNPSP